MDRYPHQLQYAYGLQHVYVLHPQTFQETNYPTSMYYYYGPEPEVPYVSPPYHSYSYEWRSDMIDAASNSIGFSMAYGEAAYIGNESFGGQNPPQVYLQPYSIRLENPGGVFAVRYLHPFELESENYDPQIYQTNLPYHLEDDVMVLDVFAPTIPYEVQSASEDSDSSTTPDNVEISDATIEIYLKKKTYVSSTKLSKEAPILNDDHDICVVCLDEYENSEEIGALRCGHEYHVGCIKTWLRKRKECPMCRATVLELDTS